MDDHHLDSGQHPHQLEADVRSRRVVHLVVLAGLLATVAAPAALPSVVRAAQPQRSGTIIGGVGETPVSPWVRGMEGCVGAPTCSAWLQSGCAPQLAGMNPALQAAIVDVGDLADSRERTLALRGELIVFGARYTVQFWTESHLLGRWDWCGEILHLRFRSWDCVRSSSRFECPFRIPPGAKWMTITASPENAKLSWTLT